MKNKKLLIASIASLLSVGVLAGSLALYVDKSQDITTNIEIGEIGSKEATVTIDANTIKNKEISPDNRTNSFAHKINHTKADAYSQDTTLVDMKLEITVKTEAIDLFTLTPSMTGYGDYWNTQFNNIIKGTPSKTDTTTKAGYTIKTFTFSGYPLDNKQTFNFGVSLNEAVKDYETFSVIDKLEDVVSYSFDVLPLSNQNYKFAHLRGTIEGCSWTDDVAKFQMIPDAQAAAYLWKYENINLKQGEVFKGYNLDDNEKDHKWSKGVMGEATNNFDVTPDGSTSAGNLTVKTTGNYDIRWDGVNGNALVITQHA